MLLVLQSAIRHVLASLSLVKCRVALYRCHSPGVGSIVAYSAQSLYGFGLVSLPVLFVLFLLDFLVRRLSRLVVLCGCRRLP